MGGGRLDHMSAETDGVRRRRFRLYFGCSWGLRVASDHMSAKADGVRRRKVSFVFRLFVGPWCGVRRNVSEPVVNAFLQRGLLNIGRSLGDGVRGVLRALLETEAVEQWVSFWR